MVKALAASEAVLVEEVVVAAVEVMEAIMPRAHVGSVPDGHGEWDPTRGGGWGYSRQAS